MSSPSLDIVGHEFAHGVDDSEGELTYFFQSGALDESFADIFGYFVDPDDWQMGEGSALGVILVVVLALVLLGRIPHGF